MKKIGLLAALVLLAALTVQAQLNGVTAVLQLRQDQYLPDEDLQMSVKIVNRSGQDITLGAESDWITFSIQGENSFICSKLGEMPVKGVFTLHSGEAGTRALNPTPYFDFRRPGRYRLSARIKIPQWNQEITCKAVAFTVGNGVEMPNLGNLQFGMPTATGAAPEVRKYSLLRVSYVNELKLYFRLTDYTGKTLRVFPIAGMTSFSEPEAQIDRFNNLHVLHQIGARSFCYAVISPEGKLVVRQTHEYSGTRPVLRATEDGQVFVAGGARRFAASDLPPAGPESANRQR
ncbi:MAG TPA: hypothetical protein VFC44_22925 [Candidatus Saccharimonadales bacterium]|nr:hypothetical protein [Candidatus Saccharimonadales bacterium]